MDRKFDVAKWRNDQYSKEIEQIDTVSQLRSLIREEIQKIFTENSDNDELKVGKHPKTTVSKFDWAYLPGKDKLEAIKITKSIIDNLPDELMYTGMQYSKDAQKAIPRFKLAGKPKDTGDSMAGFDPEKEKSYAEKRKRDKNI